MVGLERSVLPLVGERDFQLSSHTAILSFVVAFGAAKAFGTIAPPPGSGLGVTPDLDVLERYRVA
jgi:uncharacterized membrane protein YbhN (UPF0104 family)